MPSKQVPYTAATAILLNENDKRTVVVVINMSGAQTAYINDESTVSATQGIELRPHANVVMEQGVGWNTTGRWHCMGSGAGNLNVYEGFGKIPSPNGDGNGNGLPPGNCPDQAEPIMGS